LSLVNGAFYYFTVKSVNGAGLESIVTNSDGQQYIIPSTPPIAGFTTSNTTICLGESLQLNNTSTDATSYVWSSTGGSLSSTTASNPTISFTTSGSYTVDLTATGPGGTDNISQSLTIIVDLPPVALASPSTTTVTLPSSNVSFTNTSSNATSYYWDFGDGNTSTGTSPNNTYTSSGIYNGFMIALNGTCSNDTSFFSITVNDAPTPPDANFAPSSTNICQGDGILLTNTSTDATSYLWTASGGTLTFPSVDNAELIVTTSGSYTVDLTATGPGGTNTSSQTLTITIIQPPVASATPSSSSVSLPFATVSFSNTSTDATSYYWDFEDGNTSTLASPSNSYSFSGTYTVMLIASNGVCSDDTTYFTIDVLDAPTPPVSIFSLANTTICQGENIQLTNSSTNATSYLWTTNGGTLSNDTTANPTISFTTSGSYTIDLEATGVGGTDVSSQTITITIVAAPIANTTPSSDTVYLPNGIVSFTNTSSNSSSYAWDFGNGNTSTDSNPWNDYTSLGNYDVTLIASSNNCPNDTATITIVVAGYVSIKNNNIFESIQVYPNPVQDQLNISIDLLKNERVSIELIDITGRQIGNTFNQNLENGNQLISIDLTKYDLSKGLYRIVLNNKFSASIIVQ